MKWVRRACRRRYTPGVPTPPFTLLARVYDAIMDDIDYDAWGAFILEQARARGWRGGLALDLGCGTGNSTAPLIARGVEVVGLDASAAMLAVARAKLPAVRFVEGDFRDFALPERFGLAYSVFDALNNLLDLAAFSQMAARVRAQLEPGGLFIFDANTTAGLRELWEAGRVEGFAGEVYYRWEHSFDEASGLAKVEAYCEDGQRAFTEVHYERPYDPPLLRHLLGEAGFAPVEVIDYPEGAPAGDDAPRVWVVARAGPGGA